MMITNNWSILITGANRGLGLGVVKYLLSNTSTTTTILASCRRPDLAQELQELKKSSNNLHILKLDVLQLESFNTFAEEVKQITEDNGLNVLLNNAGISTKFTTLNLVKSEQMVENFMVNTVAPVMLSKALLPLLKTASDKNADVPMSSKRACIVNMSSVLASIEMNNQGGFYPYRCSKSALNAATKSMSVDLKKFNILTISMHPGWVKTDMGGKQAPIDVDTSIAGIMNTVGKLNEQDNGSFYQYDGTKLTW